MFKIVLISSLFVVFSCGSSKEKTAKNQAASVSNNSDVSNEDQQEERPLKGEVFIEVQGIVRIHEDGCPPILEMTDGDLFSKVYPINLDKSLAVDGKKISFTYNLSKEPLPEGCSVDNVITIMNVKVL